MNNAIGRRLYYLKTTGEVIQDTGERTGWVVETTVEQDFATYLALQERVPDTVGMIQLGYGAYDADRAEGGIITRIDLDKLEPLFAYPDPVDPETPQEPRPALSKEVDALKQADLQNKEAIAALYEMQLGADLEV
ncbi:hypothetical protein HP548_29425 [Paenibacillus taichungensis]|uniref:Uncharacterized protein n=1 Tax=Paenibacillus taichungensis TaxID=484184 RepID=A0ABX2MVT9_9BACL|nr:hypothetical protein [Paenibacillus taichungensis]NUU58212.1 hypothetical protein [Paenibacillus taichungensis]